MNIPSFIPAECRLVLSRWATFLKAAVPVVESSRIDAAQRYIMMFNQLPAEQTAEWATQYGHVLTFATRNKGAIAEGNPAKLARDSKDAFFASASVDCSINVATVLYACQDPMYANALWESIRGLVVPDGEPAPQPVAFNALTPQSTTAATPFDNEFFMNVIQKVHSITAEQDREDPLPENAPVQPDVVVNRIVRCLKSPEMEGLVSGIFQNAMMSQQAGGPNPMEGMLKNLFGNSFTPQP